MVPRAGIDLLLQALAVTALFDLETKVGVKLGVLLYFPTQIKTMDLQVMIAQKNPSTEGLVR